MVLNLNLSSAGPAHISVERCLSMTRVQPSTMAACVWEVAIGNCYSWQQAWSRAGSILCSTATWTVHCVGAGLGGR